MLNYLVRLFVCICVCASVSTAYAQDAHFSGQVTDSQNAAIPNASVRAINQNSHAASKGKTDGTGNYSIPFLPAGDYKIEVQAPGFGPSLSREILLSEGQTFIYNIQLSVASTQSSVEVTGNSEVTQVNTDNAEISGTVTENEVKGLQLNGRNYTQLIALTPGVSNQTQQDEAKVGLAGSVAFSVNGGRTEYNSFLVDGSETLNVGINRNHSSLIVTPSIDAIAEIKVLTSNYGARYSSNGSGMTLVTTKSGSDQYHGSLYEFLRNEDFNAKGYFDVTNGPPLYRRNDFGGTIGGPLSIPHLYDARGKTHFFFSEEARIEKTPTAYRQGIPSLAERNGDFSDVCPYAPAGQSVAFSTSSYPDCPSENGQGHPGATFPSNQIGQYVSPVYRTLMNTGVIPNPNATGGCNSTIFSCYNTEVSLPSYWREELFRIDHIINSQWIADFHYIHDEYSNTAPVPQYGYVQNSFPTIENRVYGPGLSLAAQLIYTRSPSLVNEFGVSYTDSIITFADIPGAPNISLKRPAGLDGGTGLGALFNNGFGDKLPGISIAGNNAAYGGFGFAIDPGYMPWSHTNPIYSFSDNVTKTWRKHDFQFGAQWIIFQRNQVNGPIGAATGDVQGLLTFSNQRSVFSTGNAFADFVEFGGLGTGGPASFQQDSAQGKYYQRYQIVEPYFQDNWKILPRVTMNAGVRVSLFGTYHEKNHNAYNWVPSAYSTAVSEGIVVDPIDGSLINSATNTPLQLYTADGNVNPSLLNGIVRCGVNGVPDGCMAGHLWNPSPRVGVVWDAMGNGKFVIRSGYGLFYEHGTSNEANTGSLEGSAPMVLSMEELNPQRPSGIRGVYPLNFTSIPTKAIWPYVQQWSLGIERQFTSGTLFTVGYVGSKGSHLALVRQLNQLLPTSNSINPFRAHEPLLTRTCASAALDPNGGLNIDNTYTLPNGTVVEPQSPAYTNLQVACYGYASGVSGITPSALVQYAPGIGQIYSLENVANSSYNSLQTTLRRISGPLTLGVAYSYSHSLDDASDRSDTTFVNSYDTKSNRASSNFDQRHLLHISYLYNLPVRSLMQSFFSNITSSPDPDDHSTPRPVPGDLLRSSFWHVLLDDWQLSGLTMFESGIPFTVLNNGSANGVSSQDNAGVFNGVGIGSYPDLVGNPYGAHPKIIGTSTNFGPLLLNPGAFAAPQGLTFGTAGRNSLNNPHRWNFDTALAKHIALGETRTLEFRAEAFNVFNHTQFRIYDPVQGNQANNTVSCYGPEGAADAYSAGDTGNGTTDKGCLAGNSFLHPVDTRRPRTIQFGLRLAF